MAVTYICAATCMYQPRAASDQTNATTIEISEAQ